MYGRERISSFWFASYVDIHIISTTMSVSAASAAAYQSIGNQNVLALQEVTQEFVVNATLLLASLSYLTPSWPQNAVVSDGETFDFVVVGGGAAGCILAARLTENPNWNVLLIEAGGDPPLAGVVPGANLFLIQSQYDWNYTQLYPPEHLLSKATPDFISAGKLLGGSSGNMYMEYVRGSRLDYEAWGELFPEWNYESVLPYFKKLEGLQVEEILNDPVLGPYHNADGPIKISQTTFPENLEEKINVFIDMYGELGVKHNIDYNGPEQLGVSKNIFTHSKPEPHSMRYGSAQAYLVPARDRKNLYVLKDAYATRLIIENKVANGVEVLVDGVTKKFYASNEVIVSGGIAGSTKLLVASGIGAASDLERLSIDVVADLPVGYNMEDHGCVVVVLAGHSDLRTNIELRQPYLTLDGFSAPTLNTFYSLSGADNPDIQITNFYYSVTSPIFFEMCSTVKAFNFNTNVCKHAFEANLIHELWAGQILLSHPKSKGRIIVNSIAPEVNPVFDLNYFSDEGDVDRTIMRESIRFFARLTETNYLKNQSFVVDMGLPSCGPMDFDSDEYLDCFINSLMESPLTFTGTTAMGKVVDVDMKVYGVEKLRVIDAGSIPVIPSGNTFIPTAMLAEKMSDVIKAEYGFTDGSFTDAAASEQSGSEIATQQTKTTYAFTETDKQ